MTEITQSKKEKAGVNVVILPPRLFLLAIVTGLLLQLVWSLAVGGCSSRFCLPGQFCAGASSPAKSNIWQTCLATNILTTKRPYVVGCNFHLADWHFSDTLCL